MTDLTGKFDALETNLGGKLDTIILYLDDIKTALTASGGSIEAAPIVAAIEALRGTGPENTIRSINQSLWNIAGPTPGKSLAEIYTLLTVNHAALGIYLAAIGADTDATANALGIPTGDATTTLLGVMYSLQYIIGHINQGVGGIPYEALTLTTVRGLISQLTAGIEQVNRNLDPLGYEPVDVCDDPYCSISTSYINLSDIPIVGIFAPGTTTAVWPSENVPDGLFIWPLTVHGYAGITAIDWSDWNVYVATGVSQFAITNLDASSLLRRYQSNQWVQLPPSWSNLHVMFSVDGSEYLKVYICPSGQLVGGTAPSGTDFTSSTGTSIVEGRRYVVWPDIEGLTEGAGGVELTPAASWDGYEVYIQTSAPAARLHDVTDPAQDIASLQVNQWLALGQNHTLKFSVDAGYLVKGYMRAPAVNQNCQTFNSVVQVGADRAQFSSHPPYFTVSNVAWALQGNYSQYTVELISGTTNITINVGPDYNDVASQSLTLHPGDPPVLLGISSTYLWTYSAAPFSLKMCPP
jgi:hypothetical protein